MTSPPQPAGQPAVSGFPQTLPALLARAPRDGLALVYGDRTWTYAELDTLIARVAGGLAEAGIAPGDRIGLWLPNCPAYVALHFACARLGAIAVAVNTRFRRIEVEDIVSRGRCKALAVWPSFRGIDFAGLLDALDPGAVAGVQTLILCEDGEGTTPPAGLPSARRVDFADLAAARPLAGDLSAPDAACNLFTTSGTTSKPKFVVHRQSVVARHAVEVAEAFGYGEPDAVMLQVLPLCGVFGFCAFMAAMAAGRPCILCPTFDAEQSVMLVERHAVTHMAGGDDMADRMLSAAQGRRFASLRRFSYARFNPALADIVERAEAQGMIITGVYGSSEMLALFSTQPLDAPAERRKRGGGLPVSPETRIRVRDRESGRLLPHGEPGELEIRAPSRMVGYDANDAATAAAFTDDGWFRSGDMGYTTGDEGFVYLARYGDALRLGGFLTHPAEIEEHLLTHPAVDGAQVVGVTGAAGDIAVAFVTLRTGTAADEPALQAHCKGALATFKQPRRVLVVDAFPTTPSANGTKIQRAKLREMAAALLAGTGEGGVAAGQPAAAGADDPAGVAERRAPR